LAGINVDRCGLFHLGPDGSLLAAHQFPPGLGLYDHQPLGGDSLLMAGNIQHGPNDYSGLFVPTDPAGSIGNAWSVNLGVDRTFIVRLLPAMDQGYFALAGCRDGITPPGTPDTIAAGLLRLNSAGELLWAVRFSNPERCLYPADMTELVDGDVMLACNVPLENEADDDPIDILRIGPTGSLRWAKRVHRSPAITIDPQDLQLERWQDEEVILTGWTGSPPHAFMLRCDTSFAPLDGIEFDRLGTMKDAYVTSSGQLALTTLEGGPLTPNVMHCPVLMMSDTNAVFTCAATPIGFQVDPLVIVGASDHTVADEPITTIDITSLTTVVPSPDLPFDPCLATDIANAPGSMTEAMVRPNPASDRVTISAALMERIEVIDAIGRAVLVRSFPCGSSIELDVRGIPQGLYHVRIRSVNGWIGGKLIKE